jgi:type VI secretion system ImpJ/VasE family protein
MAVNIHWSEGLFLQPHHLQISEHSTSERIRGERRLSGAYPWGVLEARLSRDELESFRLRFDRLRVIMPSGLEVNYPEDTELPTFDVRQALARSNGTLMVKLAVPLWHGGRRNTMPEDQSADARSKFIYTVAEVQRPDENTGENPQPIRIRKLNARLLLGNEDESDLEVLPLVRVLRAGASENSLPREDLEYVPPCLLVRGSAVLYELIRDLSAQVEASRKELVNRLGASAFAMEKIQGSQIESILRLRTLNRFSAILPPVVNTPNVTPFQCYLLLRELLGELAALHPVRDPFEVPNYDHENLYNSFFDLAARVRELLRGRVEAVYEEVPFKDVDGKPVAQLTDAHFTHPNAWFLGVFTRLDPQALANYLIDADRFKVLPLSYGDRAIRGIELKWEPVPPPGLPTPTGLYYFRLQHTVSARVWAVAQTEKALTIRMKTTELDWTDTRFTLFMTLPAGAT